MTDALEIAEIRRRAIADLQAGRTHSSGQCWKCWLLDWLWRNGLTSILHSHGWLDRFLAAERDGQPEAHEPSCPMTRVERSLGKGRKP